MQFVLVDLSGFAAAGFLLLLAAAAALIAVVLANTLGKAPVIGPWVARDLAGWFRDASNALIKASSATWHFMTGMFNWAQDILTKPLIYAYNFAASAVKAINTLFTQTIPDAENRALNYALGLVRTAEADADHLFTVARTDIDAVARTAAAQAETLFKEAESYADRAVSDLRTAVDAAITAAERTAASEVSAAEQALAAGITSLGHDVANDLAGLATSTNSDIARLAKDITAEGQAVAAVASANLAAAVSGIYTDLDTWGNRAVAEVWPDADADIDALRQAIGSGFPDINGLLGDLAGLGAAGLLGALIRSIAGTAAVTELAADCIVPNCQNLSQLGRDLQELLSLASTAAMIAWLVFAVTDPAGAAADIQDVALNPLRTVITDASHLFGGP